MFGFLAFLIFMLGLPGRIAVARNHPDAEAVYAMGWAGFLAIVPWIQAFIWAFKPTDIVDIRRFPDEEREAIKEDIARLKSYAYGKKSAPRMTPRRMRRRRANRRLFQRPTRRRDRWPLYSRSRLST